MIHCEHRSSENLESWQVSNCACFPFKRVSLRILPAHPHQCHHLFLCYYSYILQLLCFLSIHSRPILVCHSVFFNFSQAPLVLDCQFSKFYPSLCIHYLFKVSSVTAYSLLLVHSMRNTFSHIRKNVNLSSCIILFAVPWSVGHQAPVHKFSRQDYWSG